VSAQHLPPWLANTLQPAAAALLVVDLADPGCVEQVDELHRLLSPARVTLTGSWEPYVPGEDDDLFAVVLPTLLVASKADQLSDPEAELATFRELTGYPYPAVSVSAVDGRGLDRLGPFLFEHLGVVRVYTKIPGQPPDMTRPFTVQRGQTVGDVAVLVHKEIAADLRYARLWGRDTFDGQQVGRDHALADGDVVELHT
jgi:50S ribosomal subunit-associated GTPase HflX